MRVLIVEDDDAVGGILQDFLLELGHEPELVRTAEEALPRLHDRHPDLILLDLRLPGMSGRDFLELPLVRDARVPIIVISGVATEEQARECLRLGARDFVQKPIPFPHLETLLECVAPEALLPQADPGDRSAERRRAPRARVALPVRVRPDTEHEWETTSVDLGVEAIKVRAGEIPRPGPTARLSVATPDADDPLEIDSVLIRVDLDGFVYYFLHLTEPHFERLRHLVDRMTAHRRSP